MNIHSIYENNIHFKKHLKKILRREVLKNDGCKRINEVKRGFATGRAEEAS